LRLKKFNKISRGLFYTLALASRYFSGQISARCFYKE